jgi:hypothetical protein
MLKFIRVFLFGQRAQGEKIITPRLKTMERTYTQDEVNEWAREVKFGSRYGTKGSFYQRTFNNSYF